MNDEYLAKLNQDFNPKWQYTAKCFPCQTRFFGTKNEIEEIVKNGCGSNGGTHKLQSGGIYICSLPGGSICRSCNKWYKLVKGGENTEDQCDDCARLRKALTPLKMGTSRRLRCDGFFSLGNLKSDYTAHQRNKFLIGGEDWACSVTNYSSNFYMGDSSDKCLRKGRVHVEDLEKHGNFPGAAQEEYCGIMCETHAKRLQKQWAVKLTPVR